MWDDLNENLDSLRSQGRLRQLQPRRIEGVHLIDQAGRRLINFGSNDYLGLASFLASKTIDVDSVGARASGLVCGWTDRHQLLAEKIAAFERTEAAIVFPSGFAACSGTVSALCRQGDLILSDALNHASLIDGCRLSKADRIVYPHRDVKAVARLLAQHRTQYRRVWIVTDSVFSMDGHVAPLRELCGVASDHDATLIVDEAHGTGILGDHVSGACESLGVKDQVPIRIGTLSKALGGQGGFVACPRVVAEFLVNHCRPLIYSTALSMPAVESAIVALEHPDELRRRRELVCALSRQLRSQLGLSGVTAIESGIPIIPIPIGSDAEAVAASQRLYESGMFVPAIRPPTVPEGQARLRVSLSADHRAEMLGRLIEGLPSF
ncbi:aminotransferase class I/II-fold pyridoxal phosphate-dependent enzyme [Rhodopirellula sp. JC639]|uniref:aminotransferase class I/II-fold pyridoxal phosphate-dependent enzyme n=1 Tax=Stieleria mannarensis TaxID=2755585 RepID=UPI001600D593|nr:8-amino-7-oxononanoate synthase [Rhodopirellula sp. JC639]